MKKSGASFMFYKQIISLKVCVVAWMWSFLCLAVKDTHFPRLTGGRFCVILPRLLYKYALMAFNLFLTFFKIGAFTFGGGWAMISIIEKEVVDKHRWLARKEFIDLLAVAQSLPGILAVNIAVAVGDKIRGFKGSVCSALGAILPSFIMILLIAVFLTPDMIKNDPVLSSIFKGIRPAVVALIIAPVLTSARTARIDYRTAVIPVAVALLIWSKWPVVSNPIIYIVLGAIGGYLYFSYIQKRVSRTENCPTEKGGDKS